MHAFILTRDWVNSNKFDRRFGTRSNDDAPSGGGGGGGGTSKGTTEGGDGETDGGGTQTSSTGKLPKSTGLPEGLLHLREAELEWLDQLFQDCGIPEVSQTVIEEIKSEQLAMSA